MKYVWLWWQRMEPPSRPARGAWVEILATLMSAPELRSRAPQGARGLKSSDSDLQTLLIQSRPARGAWVEIELAEGIGDNAAVAPRKGRVG